MQVKHILPAKADPITQMGLPQIGHCAPLLYAANAFFSARVTCFRSVPVLLTRSQIRRDNASAIMFPGIVIGVVLVQIQRKAKSKLLYL
jgi:hypothetical protein